MERDYDHLPMKYLYYSNLKLEKSFLKDIMRDLLMKIK